MLDNFSDWPIIVAGEWRYYEEKKGNKTHVIFIDYRKQAATNYERLASKGEMQRVAETCHGLLLRIWEHLDTIYRTAKGTSVGMPMFAEFLRDKVQAAGHGLGGQLLAAITQRIQTAINSNAKFGEIYGLDVPTTEPITDGPPQKFFHLSRNSAHRVSLLLGEWENDGSKYAEGHFNYHVNGPIGPIEAAGIFQAQPGCKARLSQSPISCSYQRSLNLFRASLRDTSDYDSLLVGFRYERNSNVVPGKHEYPKLTATMELNRQKTSVFGINNPDRYVYPKPEDEIEIYFLPTAPCSPYNHIKNKLQMKLPEIAYEYTDRVQVHSFAAIEKKFYRFSEKRTLE